MLLLAVAPDCASADDGVCASITSQPNGIHLSDCSNGTVALSDIQYDRNYAKVAYDFVVTCHGRSARGSWSRARGVKCLEGATDPCRSTGVCTPTSEEDCRNIANCKQWGDCGYQNGQCVPTEDGCAHSEVPCGLAGACHLGPGGTCTVLTDDDCRRPFGDCPDCAYKGACATSGHCFADNGQCVARSSADCRRSSQCAFAGKCSLDGNDCVAASDADCIASEVCRTSRQCTAIDGVCTVRTP